VTPCSASPRLIRLERGLTVLSPRRWREVDLNPRPRKIGYGSQTAFSRLRDAPIPPKGPPSTGRHRTAAAIGLTRSPLCATRSPPRISAGGQYGE
jgi:hypothetical protein